ncbi:MAG: type II secretion system protein [Candidatus Peribacteria bacterium]|nr:MAG: type II secretion system protein [Candidatus Peribacteria bacterium]
MELIVVITILAILGTIAFISLQGYSSDARNTKRTNDLSSIQSSISVKQTEGASLLSFITGTGSRLSSVSVAGTGVTAGSNYEAGDVNYTALGIKTADFQDPNGDNYVIGVTTKVNGKFELAASIEQ